MLTVININTSLDVSRLILCLSGGLVDCKLERWGSQGTFTAKGLWRRRFAAAGFLILLGENSAGLASGAKMARCIKSPDLASRSAPIALEAQNLLFSSVTSGEFTSEALPLRATEGYIRAIAAQQLLRADSWHQCLASRVVMSRQSDQLQRCRSPGGLPP